MDYKQYEELKYMLCEELEKIVEQGELTAGSLETVHKLTDTIKNVDKINILETVHKLTDTIKNVDKINMLEEGEYSQAGEWIAGGNYGMRDDGRMSYRDGGMGGSSYRNNNSSYRNNNSSYRDGGSTNRNNSSYRRDGSSYREDGSSYRRGRDRMGRFTSRAEAKDEMMYKLEEMMAEASEKERGILERAMRQLENA